MRKKIAVVNVFFAPQTIGGATRVVVDEVDELLLKYSDQFDIVVFTSSAERKSPYELNVYSYKGAKVYSVSIAWREHMDWMAEDALVTDVFEKFVDFERPDLIHFHCVQRLGVGILGLTQELNIPSVVTVHDAWWISDYQFLTTPSGKVFSEGHPDELEPIELPPGISITQSALRKTRLKALLRRASLVLTVSECYRALYGMNGIKGVQVNRNGISPEFSGRYKNTLSTRNVVCAHIGGMSKHKGFHLFQKAATSLASSNIEIVAVDHSQPPDYKSEVKWGLTPVTVVGRLPQNEMISLYERIDVLFAPSIWPESFGLVSREAAALGVWVVASDVGAIGEDITRTSGFVISPNYKEVLSRFQYISDHSELFKGLALSPPARYASEQVAELVEYFCSLT